MRITNTGTAPVALPNGVEVAAKAAVDVADAEWKAMQAHPVVAAWVKAGALTAAAPPKGAKGAADDGKPADTTGGATNPLA